MRNRNFVIFVFLVMVLNLVFLSDKGSPKIEEPLSPQKVPKKEPEADEFDNYFRNQDMLKPEAERKLNQYFEYNEEKIEDRRREVEEMEEEIIYSPKSKKSKVMGRGC
jgi:hypothetical protein